jgi:glucokinase
MSRVLLADVGGTYARFTLAGPSSTGATWRTEVQSWATPLEAIQAFLALDKSSEPIEGALLAAAGPVEGGRCRLTNAAWTLDEQEIVRHFPFAWARIVNDLEAVAAGLKDLDPAQSIAIGAGMPVPGAPIALLSPGTGLGMACLAQGPGGPCVVSSEGGHASLAGMDDRYDRIVAAIRRRHGRASIERVLSGPGLANLHQAVADIAGSAVPRLTPSDITTAAFDGSSPHCHAAIDAFCAFLGAVAGDIALTFGARGGVFIGGGIVPRFVEHLARSDFREQFEAKGRLSSYLERVPTRVILHPNPAFVGLAKLAELARRHLPDAPGL